MAEVTIRPLTLSERVMLAEISTPTIMKDLFIKRPPHVREASEEEPWYHIQFDAEGVPNRLESSSNGAFKRYFYEA